MRKIEIPGGQRAKVQIDAKGGSDLVGWYDLKGPRLGERDLKTRMCYRGLRTSCNWKSKDKGFQHTFKDGVTFRECAAREAATVLMKDAFALKDSNMTDYSVFMAIYADNQTDDACPCDNGAGTFPIVLRLKERDFTMNCKFARRGHAMYVVM